MGFIERLGVWTSRQSEAAQEVLSRVEANDIRWVRLSFVDQHGLLRGKTLTATALHSALCDGVTAVSTLLSKDTSGVTVFSAFNPDGGTGLAEMKGAADLVMVPDPTTFRVLGWSDKTAWILCDLRFKNGDKVPFCTRTVYREALEQARARGFEFKTGLEIEFHLYKRLGDVDPETRQGPTRVESLNAGYQLLSEERGDALEPVTQIFRDELENLGINLRTIEVEYGPSQVEVTLEPGVGLDPADSMVLLRSAVKQLAQRSGYHATFMCRPQIVDTCSSGWHLHQCLLGQGDDSARNAFLPDDSSADLTPVGQHFVAGQLRQAAGTTALAVPTINGYKRFQPYSMAPDRICWARDNRGAMIRVVGSAGDGSTHIENRVGEPAANPYLYMASQLLAGLAGVDEELPLVASADDPYTTVADRLPANLAEAVNALDDDLVLRKALGSQFVDYYVALKRAEIARFERTVTDWEQREYFDLY